MRTLMLSTAVALPLMMAPALGQDTAAPAPEAEATETMDTPMGAETAPAADPAVATEAEADGMTEEAVAASGKVEQEQAENELRIDWITDATVMSPDGNSVGDINDVIVDAQAGTIKAAVIGVGGFLGIGEKQIAVPWDQLTFDYDAQRITSDLTREEAEAAPEYVFRTQADAPAMTEGTGGAASTATGGGETSGGGFDTTGTAAETTTTTVPAATTTTTSDTMAPSNSTSPDPAAADTVVTPDAAAASSASGEAGTTGAPSPADTAEVPATEPENGMEAENEAEMEMESESGTEAAPAN